MLTILAATAIGLYVGNRLDFRVHPEEAFISIAAPALPTDIKRFYASICFVCAWSIAAGKGARSFVDTVALPWARAFGFQVPPLPSLPTLPKDDDDVVSAEYMAENYTPGPRMGSMQLMIPKPLGHNF